MTNTNLPLADLVLNEKTLVDLVLSTGVYVATNMMPTAKLIAADIALASVFCQDLPIGTDIEGVISTLATAKDPRTRASLPELTAELLQDLKPQSMTEDIKIRWDYVVFFFSVEGAIDDALSR